MKNKFFHTRICACGPKFAGCEKGMVIFMKKAIRNIPIILGILGALGIFIMLAVAYVRGPFYAMRDEAAVLDSVQSADGKYEVILERVGLAEFPFGAASGRLVLKNDGVIVSKADFEIAHDGAQINERCWSVTWHEDHVKIILSGEEQYDELVALYYGGEIERNRLTTHWGVEKKDAGSDVGEEVTELADDTDDMGSELSREERLINDGYLAVYVLFSDQQIDQFAISYGAKESSSVCVIREDENVIEYLIYNGKSKNEKCGLYVHYQSEKSADGAWSAGEGTIVDIYAYAYESGEVVSSGITHWGECGSDAYQKATEE